MKSTDSYGCSGSRVLALTDRALAHLPCHRVRAHRRDAELRAGAGRQPGQQQPARRGVRRGCHFYRDGVCVGGEVYVRWPPPDSDSMRSAWPRPTSGGWSVSCVLIYDHSNHISPLRH